MLCAISGEAPEVPVVSKKTGTVYEKRLIEKHIEEHGTEPGTEIELEVEDILPLKADHIVRPRPPSLTSIPALLATFQNEWDTLTLETYMLQEQLSQTRMELSTALYQHDAAIRVIARLTKERDDARKSLSQLTVAANSGIAADGGNSMAVDGEELPESLAEQVNETHKSLSKSRKKRVTPKDWVSNKDVASFTQIASSDLHITRATSLTIEAADRQYAAIAGLDGSVGIYAVSANILERTLAIGEPITAALWSGDACIVLGTARGSLKIYKAGLEVASLSSHAGAITGLAVHPSGRILASVSADKTIAFYDLIKATRVSRAHSSASLTTCAFHPDGHLLAAGTTSGDIQIYMTTSGDLATSFALGASVQALAFSENGYWIAATAKGQTTITVFDLRKEGEAATAKVLDVGSAVVALAWDYSGQFLATAGPAGLTVQHFAKGTKTWSQTLSSATPAVAIQWGAHAKQLLSVNADGVLSVVSGTH
ncbi:hypothetical protein SEPCBS119000_006439 [Sporothrix epigloea]|uniref:Pre-mRNA-processing factor 19 n=1 Tax=Sporothrix epigloea TaxID=1892477 RepID=A0ABP0E309_9PEZI